MTTRLLHIEIDNCVDCPWLLYQWSTIHPHQYSCRHHGDIRLITGAYNALKVVSVPSWCPLPKKEAE